MTDKMSLSPTKYEEAEKKYNAVGKWLAESSTSFLQKTEIYPQGSMRLGTTIKPYANDEFDIDLVVKLPNVNKYENPNTIKEYIGNRLKDHETYKKNIESLNRGWRLNYAGDFHMDITPAIPNNDASAEEYRFAKDAEYVPDKKLQDWKDSNPKGFAEWFDEIDKVMPSLSFDDTSRGLAAMESIEELPLRNEFKGFLKRTIQLLKRHRDVYFNERKKEYKDYQPISVLITTIVARTYRDFVGSDMYSSPIDLLEKIVRHLHVHIKNKNGEFWVENPTNGKENFAEKWNTNSRYNATFQMWQKDLHEDIKEILELEGLHKIGKKMNESFGSRYVSLAIDSLNKEVASQRDKGLLAGGIISSVDGLSSGISKNTFYGSEK